MKYYQKCRHCGAMILCEFEDLDCQSCRSSDGWAVKASDGSPAIYDQVGNYICSWDELYT